MDRLGYRPGSVASAHRNSARSPSLRSGLKWSLMQDEVRLATLEVHERSESDAGLLVEHPPDAPAPAHDGLAAAAASRLTARRVYPREASAGQAAAPSSRSRSGTFAGVPRGPQGAAGDGSWPQADLSSGLPTRGVPGLALDLALIVSALCSGPMVACSAWLRQESSERSGCTRERARVCGME